MSNNRCALWNRGTRSAWPKCGGKGESRDQFLDQLMWEDTSSRAWTEKEELAEIVACRVRTDLGIDDEGSSRSYDELDEGGMENEGEDRVSKSRKIEKRRLHGSQAKATRRGHSEARIL